VSEKITLRIPSSGGGDIWSAAANEIGSLLLKAGYQVRIEADPDQKERWMPVFLVHAEEKK
jgi:hypothetical protein